MWNEKCSFCLQCGHCRFADESDGAIDGLRFALFIIACWKAVSHFTYESPLAFDLCRLLYYSIDYTHIAVAWADDETGATIRTHKKNTHRQITRGIYEWEHAMCVVSFWCWFFFISSFFFGVCAGWNASFMFRSPTNKNDCYMVLVVAVHLYLNANHPAWIPMRFDMRELGEEDCRSL